MLFFFTALSVLIFVYAYIGIRLIIPLRVRFLWKTILWMVLILLLPLAPVYLVLRHLGVCSPWCDVLPWIAYLSLGFFSFLFTFLVVRDISFKFMTIVTKVLSFALTFKRNAANPNRPAVPARRSFLMHTTNLGILGVSGALTGYGFGNTRYLPGVVNVSIPIRGLPYGFEGFRFVQITDLHISPTLKRSYVQGIVDQVNHLKADAVVLTGDLADGPVSSFRNDAAPLQDLSAAYGSFFVTGNHEYYMGAEAWVAEMDRLGFSVLLNEHQIIHHKTADLLVAGVTDYNAGLFIKDHVSDPNKALFGAPESIVKVLLAHQPRSIFASAKAGFDLQISGHTHGGQFYPWQLFVGFQQPYLAGLYRHDKTWVYVSRGTGYWGPPIRLGAPAEITVITLTRQDNEKR